MNSSEIILEFDKVKEMLCIRAMSNAGKKQLRALTPFLKERDCRNKIKETTEARRILDSAGNPPLSSIQEISDILELCEKGSMLSCEQLETVVVFLSSCKRMKLYLKRAESLEVELAYYGQAIYDLSDLQKEIEQSVQNGTVLSSASTQLRDIRRKIETQSTQIKKKLEELLRSKKNYCSENYISMRNGRYVLPVKKENKNQISGTVIDVSGTGSTYFIEPTVAAKLQDEINTLEMEEENEIRKILYTLTVLVEGFTSQIHSNMEAMVTLDVAFAKAKLSADMKAVAVVVDTKRTIHMKQARHPLLGQAIGLEECVPLDFSIGGETQGIVITGPNTGGKTVALKTVGLLSMMAQSGLHIPVESGKLSMHNLILCDIGDGQSITENLSTFSAHMTKIIEIIRSVNQESLVLLDELGSGTDPAEGMGIAVAILEELKAKKCLFVATTHYPQVKEFADSTKGLLNARMAFDRVSLKPLYQLEIGEAGESCALYIAKRLGFPLHMLQRAHQAAYTSSASCPDFASSHAVYDDILQKDLQESTLSEPNISRVLPPKIAADKPLIAKDNSRITQFQLGDSVKVLTDGRFGLVFQPADAKGQVGVQVHKEKLFINYKRLELKTPASELYPPDYDFSIIFDSVETRKAHNKMGKKHVPGLEVIIE